MQTFQQSQAGERTHFNPKYVNALIVLRDGTTFPVSEVFNRNPSIYEIVGIQCPDHRPGHYCFAQSYSIRGTNDLCRVTMGASGTPIAFRE